MKSKILILFATFCCLISINAGAFQGNVTPDSGNGKINCIIYDSIPLFNNLPHMKINVGYDVPFGSTKKSAIITGTYFNFATGQEKVAYYYRIDQGINDFEFLKVIKGSNGHYYVVGWALDSTSTHKQGLICEFSPQADTTLVMINGRKVRCNGTPGDLVYTDVTEIQDLVLHHNYIAAVGWEVQTNNTSSAVVTEFNAIANQCTVNQPALSVLWGIKFPSNTFKPQFLAAAHDGNIIIAGGFNNTYITTSGNLYDGVVTTITGGCSIPIATGVISQEYYGQNIKKLGHPTTAINAYKVTKLVNVSGAVVAANMLLQNASDPTIPINDGAVVYANTRTHVTTSSIQYGASSLCSNPVADMLNVLHNGENVVGISPGISYFDMFSLLTPPYATKVLEISTGPFLSLAKNIGTDRTLLSMAHDVNSNHLYAGGYSSFTSSSYKIYDEFENVNFTDSCTITDSALVDSTIITQAGVSWSWSKDTLATDSLLIHLVPANFVNLCGQPGLKSNPEVVSQIAQIEDNALVIAPNPTNGFFYATYNISESFKSASIILIDNLGRVVASAAIKDKNGKIQISIPDKNVTNQFYCSLIVDGKRSKTEKVLLIKSK